MRCPNCGGLNPDTASWCGQCFVKFDEPAPGVVELAELPKPPETADKPTDKPNRIDLADLQEAPVIYDRGFLRRQRELMGWQCHKCGSKNSMDRMDCATCGASLFESFGMETAPEPEPPPKNPSLAAGLSLVPGVGHLYLGRIGEGIARMVMAAWWLAAGLILFSAGTLRWLGVIFLAADLTLVGLTVVDGYRLAIERKSPQVFTPKLLLYSNVVLVGLLAVGGMFAAILVRR